MKKSAYVIICLSLILMNQTTKGQAGASVVTDPAAYGYLSQSVASASESAQKLGKSLQFLQEAKDAFDKVNGNLQTAERLRSIILSQKYMIENTKRSFRSLEESGQFTPAELAYVMSSFSNLISRSQSDLQFAKTIGSDGILKMTDSDRITMLTNVEEKTNANSHEAYYLDQKYQRSRQKKELVNTFYDPRTNVYQSESSRK